VARRGGRLVLKGVAKRYGETTALAPTNAEIADGEFFSLIGPSGSGKSTLLGVVAGFVPPSAGSVEIDGEDVAHLPPYRRNVGMVFQNYALFPHMSVWENVAFPLKLRKVPGREVTERVGRMLDVVRLGGMGGRAPSQLSGGQQQRVALARAAVYDPRILLMDEPLGALDKNLREELQVEIKAFHRQIGATIVYVTHDQDEAAAMSDRIAVMRGGQIVQVGRPRELYEAPRNAFVASFLGDANLFPVERVRRNGPRLAVDLAGGGTLFARDAALPFDHGGTVAFGGAVACVRPEAIALAPTSQAPNGAAVNRMTGTVADTVYAAGTVRYRVALPCGRTLTVRAAPGAQPAMPETGDAVALAWAAEDTLLIPKE
jgi:putative spermidine/putrescine transport system ATP-binding protein